MKPLQSLELDDIQIFCRTAESHSFTEASITLDVTPSAVSKAVQRLEKKLKVKLFQRSTRKMRLTEEGRTYYEICRKSLESIQEMENQLLNSSEPWGTLKISLPDSLAINRLIPILHGFAEKYNDLKLEVFLSTTFVDFIKDDVDIALRIGKIVDLSLVARLFARTEQKIVASPQYLKKHGIPKTLYDLEKHKCIGLKFPDMQGILPWRFKDDVQLNLNFSVIYDNPQGAVKTVLHGFGIIQLLDFSVNDAIANGELVELFPELRPMPMDIHVVYPSGKYMPAKVRTFIDYLFNQNSALEK